MGPCDLDAMLASLPRATPEFARLLDTRDDAAVIDLGDGRCLVQTVDFFTPIVDSGYWFGQIAAANALSDVYAMGAAPLTALNLVAWPAGLSPETLAERPARRRREGEPRPAPPWPAGTPSTTANPSTGSP